jgi:predicted nucleic acid-binding protein
MRALVDTNVILDMLLEREPFFLAAQAVWEANRVGRFDGYVCAVTPVTVFYVTERQHSTDYAFELLRTLMESFRVAPVDGTVLKAAMKLPMKDFEDAVQVVSGETQHVDFISTRDTKDFANSPIPALTPAEFVTQLA